jgi:hypothetical protein
MLLLALAGGCGTYVAPTTPTGPTGAIVVTLLPTGVATGTLWYLDGDSGHASGSTVSNVLPGSHTIHFGAVAGYVAPANFTLTLASGQTATVPASASTYVPAVGAVGAVSATLLPAAVASSALWTLDGDAGHASGAVVGNVEVGSHAVHFTTVAGYTAPADYVVVVALGQTTTVPPAFSPTPCRPVRRAP